MGLGLMASLQDGTEGPAGAAKLQQQEAAQQWAAEAFVYRVGTDQQNGASESHEHPGDGGSMQSCAAGNERFDADHPKGRHRNENGCQSARHPLLGVDQAACARADDDDSEQRRVPEFAPGGKMRL